MRWTAGERSKHLKDQRGARGAGAGMRFGLGGMVVLLVLSLVFKRDFFSLVGGAVSAAPASGPIQSTPDEERLVDFVSFVLDTAQAFWTAELPRLGAEYRPADLTLFRDAVQSACGMAQSATGPFYCPGDEIVYVDLGFYDELRTRFGAPGDFAQAYVLAHEIGHHLQNVLGIEQQVRASQRRQPGAANELSIRMELQADCLAGVWGYHAREAGILEPGDVEEGLAAAAAVGDDRIQRMGGGAVNPEGWTHGSSEQRMRWFNQGFRTGDTNRCDTFAAASP